MVLKENDETTTASPPVAAVKVSDAEPSLATSSAVTTTAATPVITSKLRPTAPIFRPKHLLQQQQYPAAEPSSIHRQKKVLNLSPPVPVQKRPISATGLLQQQDGSQQQDSGASQKPLNNNNNNATNNNNNAEKIIVKAKSSTMDSSQGGGELNNKAASCICERPPTMIVCQKCGTEFHGRVQRVCAVHPKRICLMDQRECVICRSIHLTEVE